jgi:alpha-dioxygenase
MPFWLIASRHCIACQIQHSCIAAFAGMEYVKANGTTNLWHSMMRYPAGALTLNNYPSCLRNIEPEVVKPDGSSEKRDALDMAALEIYRDRERGLPRYNEFRKWCAV